MTLLTGTFRGTAQADVFTGSIIGDEVTVINQIAEGIAARRLVIDALGGADKISATTSVGAVRVPVIATAMTGADINTGSGKDIVTAASRGSTSLETTASTGLQKSFIETEADDDLISIRSDAANGIPAVSTGVFQSTISAGLGHDAIKINSFASSSADQGEGIAIGIDQSTLLGDDGQDRISVFSEARGSGSQGSQAISIAAKTQSSIQSGADNDTITVSSRAIATGSGPSTAIATGVGSGAVVDGGDGADIINISADASNGIFIGDIIEGDVAQAYGVYFGSVLGGASHDTIKITSLARSGRNSPDSFSYGIFNSTIDGGSGNDKIELKSLGTSSLRPVTNSTHHGAVDSTIYGGIGSDTIDISVTQAENIKASVGALKSTIDAGSGQDSIKIRGLKLDLQDSLIFGGSGNDILDTGIGSGRILGGSGTDLIKLDFFNAQTMTLDQRSSNGIKITGTQDKAGGAVSWAQNIFEVESYEYAGAVYSASGIAALLG
jgi:hypothetical protein